MEEELEDAEGSVEREVEVSEPPDEVVEAGVDVPVDGVVACEGVVEGPVEPGGEAVVVGVGLASRVEVSVDSGVVRIERTPRSPATERTC